MAETTTETIQTPSVTTTTTPPVTTIPPVTTEQGTVGAPTTPAPSKISTEGTTPIVSAVQSTKLPPEEVQKRVDRMYARLMEERKRRLAAEALTHRPAITTEDGEEEIPTPSLTEADVEAVMERKDREKKFVQSEVHVFEQHPDALNEDGSFNMSNLFVQKYIEVGRRNPMLALMENGPEMASALVDKELGLDYKKGRTEEATRLTNQPANTYTTTSTTITPPNVSGVQLTDVQKKIARRMNMTDKEYTENQGSNKVVQKSWEVKPR